MSTNASIGTFEAANKADNGVARVFKILNDIDLKEVSIRSGKVRDEISAYLQSILLRLSIFSFFAAMTLAIVAWVGGLEQIWLGAIAFLLLGYAANVVSMLKDSWSFSREVTRKPLETLFRRVQPAVDADLHYLPQLMKCSMPDVENALVYVRSERESLERRTGLMIGAIDKVGMFPALVTLPLVFKNVSDRNWLKFVAYAYPLMGR